MLLKLVFDNGEAARAQQVALHELVAGLKVAAQPDAHQRQVPACREEVPALQVARRLDLAHHWQPCSSRDRWLRLYKVACSELRALVPVLQADLVMIVHWVIQMRTLAPGLSKRDSLSRLAKQEM